MSSFGKLFASVALAIPLALSANPYEATVADEDVDILRLAIVNSYGMDYTESLYSRSLEALSEALSPVKLITTVYNPDSFLEAAVNNEFDVSIASSGLTSVMIGRTSGIPLLAVATNKAPDPHMGNGAAIFVRADRDDINTLQDLKGKRLAVMSSQAFAGWQVPSAELIRNNLNPNTMFSSIYYTSAPMTQIVTMVKNRKADVGFLTTCLLEFMAESGRISMDEFKVINQKTHNDHACLHSTDLYPNWLLAVKPSVTPYTAKLISKTLLNLTKDSKLGLHWTVPTDHKRIYDLFNELDIRFHSVNRFDWLIDKYRYWIAGAATIIFIIFFNMVFLAMLVQRRTEEIEVRTKEKMLSDLAAKESAMKLENLQKASAVGMLSSMVAHELKQPLTVINNYAGSLKTRTLKGRINNEVLIEALDEIIRSGLLASSIIDRIRSYAKSSPKEHAVTSVMPVITRAYDRFRRSLTVSKHNITISVPDCEPLVEIDELELELVVHNILKNAGQACSSVPSPTVALVVTVTQDHILTTVVDNGPRLSAEQFERMGSAGYTTKSNGLGLGLAIVRSLIEIHGGSLTLVQNEGDGLSVTVKLPLYKGVRNA